MILTVTPIHVGEGDLSEDGLTTVRRVVQRHGGTLGVDARVGLPQLYVLSVTPPYAP
ncbi:hypothetical protein ACFSC4_27660 [Deinococcus malanensis]|uniref:hypothetical protein n=1 Tax=Deinococcus malanensis TaxID=1706855 RepID=UPI00364087A0